MTVERHLYAMTVCAKKFEPRRDSVAVAVITVPETLPTTDKPQKGSVAQLQLVQKVVDDSGEFLSLCLAVGAIVSTALGVYIGILFHPIALIFLVVGNSACIVCSELLVHSKKTFTVNPALPETGNDFEKTAEKQF